MRYHLGIDIGGTNIAVGIVDEFFNIIHKNSVPTLGKRSFAAVVKDVADTAKNTLTMASLTDNDIEYVGIGVPSTVNPNNQHIVFANNLGWTDVDLATEFHKTWNIPVIIGNDADCAAFGESLAGAAKHYDSTLMITLGTGVGGSFIYKNEIFKGGNGFSCEPGHIALCYNGLLCTCGRRGCLEAYASVTALIRQTIEAIAAQPHSRMADICGHDLRNITGETCFKAAKEGDEAALLVVENYVNYLAMGIISLVNVFRPDVVLIGGGISHQGEYLLAPLRRVVQETLFATDMVEVPELLKATLGNDAGIIGAAYL